MNTKRAGITVSIAHTEEEIREALEFCGSVYERNYRTHWKVPPDLFFVSRRGERIIGTGGLTFASAHPEIASERYFHLTEGMQRFIRSNRGHIVEFGRFASLSAMAAKAVLHAAISYATAAGMHFMFAWSNPSVYKHTANRLGVAFWPIVVPLNLDSALNDSRWASPPTGFFERKQPPELILGVIPFWENVANALGEECGIAASVAAWQTHRPAAAQVAAMKPTSVARSAARLLRAEDGGHGSGNAGDGSGVPLPNVAPLNELGAEARRNQQKTD